VAQVRSFLVSTDHGDVVVRVNPAAGGLDTDLLALEPADAANSSALTMVTPLRAFGAKMVDLIEMQGLGDVDVSPALRELLVREKATQELKRIERYARERAATGPT